MVTLTRSRVVGLGLGMLVAGAVLYFWPREEPGVQEAVTRRVIEATRAAEAKDVGTVMEMVSERFQGQRNWKKQDLRGVLTAQVLRGQWIRVFTTDVTVQEVTPTQATFQARLIFGRSEAEKVADLARDSVLNAYQVEGTFEKEQDGEWRVVRATAENINPAELL